MAQCTIDNIKGVKIMLLLHEPFFNNELGGLRLCCMSLIFIVSLANERLNLHYEEFALQHESHFLFI